MAQRRMFSLKIVDTDYFLDMPSSTQLLYFHLLMRADDDGFISSPKKIMKIVGCADDDMKILQSKQFIIPFESGICVIKHWRIHNYIQKDRYNPTFYVDEKKQLTETNHIYNKSIDGNQLDDLYTECIHYGDKPDTQVRLELGKDREGKDIKRVQDRGIFDSDFLETPEPEHFKITVEFFKTYSEKTTRLIIPSEKEYKIAFDLFKTLPDIDFILELIPIFFDDENNFWFNENKAYNFKSFTSNIQDVISVWNENKAVEDVEYELDEDRERIQF